MPFGKFIHHRVDEKVFFGLKPEDLNAREIANTFAFPLAKSIFDILRQESGEDCFPDIKFWGDSAIISQKSCIFAPWNVKTTQVYNYTTREIQAAETATEQTVGGGAGATKTDGEST